MTKNSVALIDLDAMLHIVANVQFKAGNLDNRETVKNHVSRFIYTIQQNCNCNKAYMFYQKEGHKNFRNIILPEYKGNRTSSDAIVHWKSTILEAFEEAGACGLSYIESDDIISVLAEKIGYKNVTIVSSDKDMKQVPGIHYNPYKITSVEADRWSNSSIYESNRFFWIQVLTGDPTDMPNTLCGIQGIGPAKAAAMCDDNQKPFIKVIQEEYTKKYGADGYARANLTYMMVRLLKLSGNGYVCKEGLEEVDKILNSYESFSIHISDPVEELFSPPKSEPPSFLIS